jgi:hypothetical protein
VGPAKTTSAQAMQDYALEPMGSPWWAVSVFVDIFMAWCFGVLSSASAPGWRLKAACSPHLNPVPLRKSFRRKSFKNLVRYTF